MAFFRVMAMNGSGHGDSFIDIDRTLTAGATTLTITDPEIVDDDMSYEFYATIYGVIPNTVTTTTGEMVLTFDAQSTDMTFRVRKWITDGGGGGGSSSWNYSTDETDTKQKWIDGSEIYCKVLDYSSSPEALPSNSDKTFSGVLPTNAQIIDADVIYGSATFKGIAKAYVTLANGNLGINSMHAVNMYYAIIRYIKTGA